MKKVLLIFILCLLSCKEEEVTPIPSIDKTSYTVSSQKALNPLHYFMVLADSPPTSNNNPSDIYISEIKTTDYDINENKEYKLLDDYENSLRRFYIDAKDAKFRYRRLIQLNSYKELSQRRQDILNENYISLELMDTRPSDFNPSE